MTKKGRTILVAFAGSIGIIGIALILAVSTGTAKTYFLLTLGLLVTVSAGVVLIKKFVI